MNRTAEQLRYSRRRKKIFAFIVSFFMINFVITYFQQMNKIEEKYAELASLQVKLQEAREHHQQLLVENRRLHDPEYREQLQRKELHMKKPEEMQFVLQGSE